ncbi:MAG: bifunctional [glutamine synthetase] adenylyltransferase/[glutamine synthetase]-adenylyl-L-tyrosine phosphorylase, partial [Pseudolabrys sp.]
MNAPNQHAGLTLAERIVAAPVLMDRPAALARVEEWLATQDESHAAPLRSLFAAKPIVGTLIAGLAESSPFLWGLVTADPARLLALMNAEPDARLAACLAGHGKAVAGTDDIDRAMRLLRQMKAEAALLIALADIGGVWPVMRATRALTDLADTAVDVAARFALAEAARAGKLKPNDISEPQIGSGYIVLAMGKMGAFELNYSSDIDLIVFFDPDIAPLVDGAEPAPTFVRITQRVVKLLQEHTGDGYVFRTDLRTQCA